MGFVAELRDEPSRELQYQNLFAMDWSLITPPRHPLSAAGASHFRVIGRSDKRPDQQAFTKMMKGLVEIDTSRFQRYVMAPGPESIGIARGETRRGPFSLSAS